MASINYPFSMKRCTTCGSTNENLLTGKIVHTSTCTKVDVIEGPSLIPLVDVLDKMVLSKAKLAEQSELELLRLENQAQRAMLVDANQQLRACFAIAKRQGAGTDWYRLVQSLYGSLEMQFAYLHPRTAGEPDPKAPLTNGGQPG